MKHISKIIPSVVKKAIPPEAFYQTALNGSFGKPTGNGWYAWNGLCPFHDDRRAGSFVINKDSGAYRCFSCGAKGGDIIDFYMEKECLGFKDALNQLGRYASCAK